MELILNTFQVGLELSEIKGEFDIPSHLQIFLYLIFFKKII